MLSPDSCTCPINWAPQEDTHLAILYDASLSGTYHENCHRQYYDTLLMRAESLTCSFPMPQGELNALSVGYQVAWDYYRLQGILVSSGQWHSPSGAETMLTNDYTWAIRWHDPRIERLAGNIIIYIKTTAWQKSRKAEQQAQAGAYYVISQLRNLLLIKGASRCIDRRSTLEYLREQFNHVDVWRLKFTPSIWLTRLAQGVLNPVAVEVSKLALNNLPVTLVVSYFRACNQGCSYFVLLMVTIICNKLRLPSHK